MSKLLYAIDFGTSNSLMAAASVDQIHPLIPLDPMASDPTVMRTLIYFENQKSVYFGNEAISHFVANSLEGRFLRSVKRFLPVKSFEGTQVFGRFRKLEDLIGCFLSEMRRRANLHYGQEVDSVILGRPALFSEEAELDRLAQSRLEAAAKIAGFKHIEFLAEPVAAAYRFQQEMKKEEIVLVADFGGGTSDYTLLKLSPQEFKPQDVLAIGGAPIAGDALDGQIMRHRITRSFGSETRYQVPFGSNILQMPKALMGHLCSTAYINLLNSAENREFLRQMKSWSLQETETQKIMQLEILLENQLGFSVFEAIEAAKVEISKSKKGAVSFHYPGIDIEEKISEPQFQEYTQDERAKIFSALDETMIRANLKPSQIDRVCCTGGTAKVTSIRNELAKRFGESRIESFRQFTSIVEGLAARGKQVLNS